MLLASAVVVGPFTSERISTFGPVINGALDTAALAEAIDIAARLELGAAGAIWPSLLSRYGCKRVAAAEGPAAGDWGAVGSSVHASGLRRMAVRNGRSRRARLRCGCTGELRGPVILPP